MVVMRTAPRDIAEPTPAEQFSFEGYDITLGVDRTSLAAEWPALDAADTATVFQSFAFVDIWCRGAAAACGETPCIVTGRRHGRLEFVLPMALVRRGGVRTLTWLAQSHASYGMGLFHSDALAAIDQRAAATLIEAIARRSRAAVVHLDSQPLTWSGHANPFTGGRRATLTANDTFVLTLDDDYQTQLQRLFSARTTAGLRRKQRRLEESGSVVFDRPVDATGRRAMVDWFAERKRDRLAEAGQTSVFDRPAIRDLYRSLAADGTGFQVDRLTVGGAPAAAALSMSCGRTTYLLNTAHAGGDLARHSPGALLLHRLVAGAHAQGLRRFDFGPGALPYKQEWEPQTIPLVSTTWAVSPVGHPVQAALALGRATKRVVKRNAVLHRLAIALRRRLALPLRLRPATPPR